MGDVVFGFGIKDDKVFFFFYYYCEIFKGYVGVGVCIVEFLVCVFFDDCWFVCFGY